MADQKLGWATDSLTATFISEQMLQACVFQSGLSGVQHPFTGVQICTQTMVPSERKSA